MGIARQVEMSKLYHTLCRIAARFLGLMDVPGREMRQGMRMIADRFPRQGLQRPIAGATRQGWLTEVALSERRPFRGVLIHLQAF
jgi:hypothetical protein